MAQVAWEAERGTIEGGRAAAEAKRRELEEQNRHLHEQLEAITARAAEADLARAAGARVGVPFRAGPSPR